MIDVSPVAILPHAFTIALLVILVIVFKQLANIHRLREDAERRATAAEERLAANDAANHGLERREAVEVGTDEEDDKSEDISSMPAGEQLDSMIAEKLMGWKMVARRERPLRPGASWSTFNGPRPMVWCGLRHESDVEMSEVPRYSTEDMAAMSVLDFMSTKGFTVRITARPASTVDRRGMQEWIVRFDLGDRPLGKGGPALKVAEALCRAALLSISMESRRDS